MIINRYETYNKDKTPYISSLFFIWMFNIVFATHFISLFFAGIVFMFFIQSVKKSYYYLLFACILTFCFIESVHGLSSFSLTLTAVFIFSVLKPQVKHLFSSKIFSKFLYLFLFYFIFFILTYLISEQTNGLILLFLINFVLDSLIFGFLLL